MGQKEKKTPDGVISIEEYLKKRKHIKQAGKRPRQGTFEKEKSSALLLTELYM